MEKVSLDSLSFCVAFGWLGIISLIGVALRFALSR
jgi:hypothetical protein